uniref:hypothetical protein n=1 Tax=Gelidibacter sp. TaxID=2018083 RepID=UPI0040490607
MKYTKNEILQIKKHITALRVPLCFEIETAEKIKVIYKYDKEIYFQLTKVFQYEINSKYSNGKLNVTACPDFEKVLYWFKNWILNTKKENPLDLNRETTIEKFSPKFYKVFEEAIIIKSLNYEESAGMIYRKSLEIIIKDFLKTFLPEYSKIILNETIGGIVFFFYEVLDDNLIVRKSRKFKKNNFEFTGIKSHLEEVLPLINFVNNTFKIGNDFSHYERKLEKYTTLDLEQNIKMIIDYIATKYKISESQKELVLIGESFKNHKL